MSATHDSGASTNHGGTAARRDLDYLTPCVRASLICALVVSGISIHAKGADPIGGSAKEFADYLQSELVRWAEVVRAANIKVD